MKVNFCPICGNQKVETHDRESVWILGMCQTFYCEMCGYSGFVDVDIDPAIRKRILKG